MMNTWPHSITSWDNDSCLNTASHPVIKDWLFNAQSMTQRLKAVSDDAFCVTVLREEQGRLQHEECCRLNLAPDSCGWIREVHLNGHGVPWVFARVVTSQSTFESSDLSLETLGERPLGSLLFGPCNYQRGEIEVCQHRLNTAGDTPQTVWVRRSVFVKDASKVLVLEMFLPALWAHIGA